MSNPDHFNSENPELLGFKPYVRLMLPVYCMLCRKSPDAMAIIRLVYNYSIIDNNNWLINSKELNMYTNSHDILIQIF